MRAKKIKFSAIILLVSIFMIACQDGNILSPDESLINQKISSVTNDGSMLVPGDLSDEERNGLIFMRNEEKVARDVYIFFGDLYNYRVFLNIKQAEDKHMAAIKRLLDRYNIPDPVDPDDIGVFPDPGFQQMYDQFILQGQNSLHEALLVGKAIEEVDISDLQFQLTFVDNQDLINVYQNLLDASGNHLIAFQNCINNNIDALHHDE